MGIGNSASSFETSDSVGGEEMGENVLQESRVCVRVRACM